MPKGPEREPNRQLAWARLERGWSRAELARRVRAEMVRCGEADTGLPADTVGRWETGRRRPEPRYRQHLVTVFDRPASELGLLTPAELAMRPVEDIAQELQRLVDVAVDGLADRGIDRATFIRGLVGSVASPSLLPALRSFGDGDLIDRLAQLLGGAARLDPTSVDAYADVVDQNRALYWRAPPAPMFATARVHAELGVHLLRGPGDEALRRRLAAATAESSLLAARLAFFDLQQPDTAQELLDVAWSAGRHAGDHLLALAIAAHAAFVPGFAGDLTTARSLLRAAARHAAYGAGARTRAWLHCVNAEIEARAGEARVCLRRIGLAEEALTRTTTGADPDWLDYFDAGRLDGFAGYCLLIAGDDTRAATRLMTAIERLPDHEVKQSVVLYADLAGAVASTDQDQAAAYLHRAVDKLETDWYAIGYARVHDHRSYLENGTRRDEITDRLTDLVDSRAP